MPIDPEAVGVATEPVDLSWSATDSLVYALGVGAGQDPTEELEFTTENTAGVQQRAVPSMAVVLSARMGRLMKALGPFDQSVMRHASEEFELGAPLPASGTVSFTAAIETIYDKGKAAIVVFVKEGRAPGTGQLHYRARTSLYLPGEGGWNGERGPSVAPSSTPERAPDHVLERQTRPEQALLYRLSGDRNPLHSDPGVAARGGLDRPILHGLCTYGFTCRALVTSLCQGDARRLRGMSARFSAPVFPGDALCIEVWDLGEGEGAFRTLGPGGGVVIDGGRCTFRD